MCLNKTRDCLQLSPLAYVPPSLTFWLPCTLPSGMASSSINTQLWGCLPCCSSGLQLPQPGPTIWYKAETPGKPQHSPSCLLSQFPTSTFCLLHSAVVRLGATCRKCEPTLNQSLVPSHWGKPFPTFPIAWHSNLHYTTGLGLGVGYI